MQKYFREYQWSNIFSMVRNLKRDPEKCSARFDNRLVVITGATSGIGKATVEKYAACGADILCINRNEQKSNQLCDFISREYEVNCDHLIADFSRLSDVHAVAKKLSELDQNIDVLIHNAGLFATRKTLTNDNLEMVFQVDYLASFILNYYTKEKFTKQGTGRILFVNSEAHRFAVWGLHLDDLAWDKHRYSGSKSYGAAKLAQLLSMIELQKIFAGSGVTINAMHPGNVKTNSGQNNGPLYKFIKKNTVDKSARNAGISAEALYYLGVSDILDKITGKFFNLTTEEEPAPPALDKDAAKELWEISIKIGGLQ